MPLLMQGSKFLEGLVTLFPSVSALCTLLLHTSCHVVYVVWNQVMVLYEILSQSSIKMIIGWLEEHPCVQSLENCDHLVPN